MVSLGCALGGAWLPACSESENSGSGGAAGQSAGSGGSNTNAGSATGGKTSNGGNQGTAGSPSEGGTNAPQGGASAAGASSGGVNASGGSSGSGGTSPGERDAAATCARWKADTADVNEGTWSGSVDTCMAGDISANGRENALRLFNLVRWLADLPAVTTEDARNQQAQACALMMTANDMLSHEPPTNWKCYTELGKQGASTSNISGAPGVSSVFSYMVDDGNLTTFGHRRIILGNGLGPIGLGSAGKNGSSCMQNIGGTGKAGKPWMAWPPPGAFPIQAYTDVYARSLDSTGWSLQSEKIELGQAQVKVTSGGQDKPVKVEQLTGTYGGAKAIRIVLDGWKGAAGETYAVNVTGTSAPISYEIQLIDCK